MSSFWEIAVENSLAAYFMPNQVDSLTDASGNTGDLDDVNTAQFQDGLYGRAARIGLNPSFQFNIQEPLLANRTVGSIALRMYPISPITFTNPLSSYLDDGSQSWRIEAGSPTTTLNLYPKSSGVNTGWWIGQPSTTFTDNNWHSLVITSDGTDTQVYFNNSLVDDSPTLEAIAAATDGWLIGGRSPDTFRTWRGYISEVVFSENHWSAEDAGNYHLGPEPSRTASDTLNQDGSFSGAAFTSHNNGAITISRDLHKNGVAVETGISSPVDLSLYGAGSFTVVAKASNNAGTSPYMNSVSNAIVIESEGFIFNITEDPKKQKVTVLTGLNSFRSYVNGLLSISESFAEKYINRFKIQNGPRKLIESISLDSHFAQTDSTDSTYSSEPSVIFADDDDGSVEYLVAIPDNYTFRPLDILFSFESDAADGLVEFEVQIENYGSATSVDPKDYDDAHTAQTFISAADTLLYGGVAIPASKMLDIKPGDNIAVKIKRVADTNNGDCELTALKVFESTSISGYMPIADYFDRLG